jgi:hypothetical protein
MIQPLEVKHFERVAALGSTLVRYIRRLMYCSSFCHLLSYKPGGQEARPNELLRGKLPSIKPDSTVSPQAARN